MKPKITGENDERVGISVIDNNDVEHLIEMEFDGEIKYHEQDGYPDDPSKRTPAGNEHVEQARKFAQFYVYKERGHDTIPPQHNPDRINAVRTIINSLSDEAFTDLFGDLHQQMQSYHGETAQVIPVPPEAPGPDSVLYCQNVYLGMDPLETDIDAQAQGIAVAHDIDLSTVTETPVTDLSDDDLDDWREFASDLTDLAEQTETDLSEGLYIDAVSSLFVTYADETGGPYYTEPDSDPHDRDPDTVIELPPIDPGPLDEFREYLDHHLKCQVRDTFVRMGTQPPQQFRVIGHGRFEATIAYKLLDLYPRYYDPDEDFLGSL